MSGEYELYRALQEEQREATDAEIKRLKAQLGVMQRRQLENNEKLMRHSRFLGMQDHVWKRRYQLLLRLAENGLRLLTLSLLLMAMMSIGGIANSPLLWAGVYFLITICAVAGAIWAAVVAEDLHELRMDLADEQKCK